jgi:signal peptidase I
MTTMVIDFPFILTSVVLLCGLIALLDLLFWRRKRKMEQRAEPIIVEYARSFFPVLLIVLLIRSFLVQPFRVPTGSLEPTVQPGDLIVVNQFAYGLRLPVLNTKIVAVGEPKVGDIALFRLPLNPAVVYVKRVVGTPGDHIVYKNKMLAINGKTMKQEPFGSGEAIEYSTGQPVELKLEHLTNVDHRIYIRPYANLDEDFDIVVPEGHYFMMGDNRDNSGDSREWGFVPEKNLIGKAFGVWMSWDSKKFRVRWDRIGSIIK